MAGAPGCQALGGLWLGGGAALGVLACLIALMVQQAHLGALRGELTQLRGELVAARRGENQGPGELEPPSLRGTRPPWVAKGKRAPEGSSRQQDLLQHHRKRSVLHLAPSHRSTNNEGDILRSGGSRFCRQGRALEVSGPDVTVKQTGCTSVYSQ
ncbi:tumor necrosis factor ligand superfamily member 13 [Pangshura tecta]